MLGYFVLEVMFYFILKNLNVLINTRIFSSLIKSHCTAAIVKQVIYFYSEMIRKGI